MAVQVTYATRADVSNTLLLAPTTHNKLLVDRKLRAATRAVEGYLHSRFYPELKTVSFDWPNYQYAGTHRLWLEGNTLISIITMTSGGVVIPSTDYILRRADNRNEPPYTYVELNTSKSSVFRAGTTSQNAIVIQGLYGYNDTDLTVPNGSLGGNITCRGWQHGSQPLNG